MPYSWEPDTQEVAVYVPWLTVSAVAPGDQSYANDFTADTVPATIEAQRHITDAALVVGAGLAASLTAPVENLARLATALLAAATLAAAYARTDDDRERAEALFARYATAKESLGTVAENAGSETSAAVPLVYAPDPVPWGDQLLQDYRSGGPARTYYV